MKLAAIISTVIAFVSQYSGAPMTQAEAQAKLEAAGVYASSPGGCTTRSNPECTSYEGILSGTVDGIIALKEACECAITITGGTELIRHAGGTYKYRHENGYRVDIRSVPELDTYVKSSFTKIGNRRDGYPQWKSAEGNIYCDEGDHWDVVYY